jgi:predicted Fe-Mo cluster-binding NifX family protein
VKVAFTTSGNDLAAPLDSRFGRAPRFLIYDLNHETFEVIDNKQNLNAAQGAGIQSAEAAVRWGAGAVVTGHCGPKAFRVLTAAGVKIYNTDAPTVAAALDHYRLGKLVEARSADTEGHWA